MPRLSVFQQGRAASGVSCAVCTRSWGEFFGCLLCQGTQACYCTPWSRASTRCGSCSVVKRHDHPFGWFSGEQLRPHSLLGTAADGDSLPTLQGTPGVLCRSGEFSRADLPTYGWLRFGSLFRPSLETHTASLRHHNPTFTSPVGWFPTTTGTDHHASRLVGLCQHHSLVLGSGGAFDALLRVGLVPGAEPQPTKRCANP